MNAKDLMAIVKASNAAADYDVGGALTPDQARLFWTTMVDQSSFMQKITVMYGKRLTIPIPVYNFNTRQLVAGRRNYTGNSVVATNIGVNMTLKDIQLYYDLPFETVENNADMPGFEEKMVKDVTKQFGNDLLDLATNGTSTESTTVTAFANINTGWGQLLKDATTSGATPKKISLSGETTMIGAFNTMLAMHDSRFKSPNCAFICSPTSAEFYRQERASGLATYSNADPSIYNQGYAGEHMGYKILTNPYMTDTYTEKDIAGFSTSDSGNDTSLEVTAHGYSAGDIVEISSDSTNYSGTHQVKTVTDANNFIIDIGYNAEAIVAQTVYSYNDLVPTIIFTDPKNLVMGLNLGIQVFREVDPRTSGGVFKYTWNTHVDFEVAMYAAASIGYAR